MPTEIGDGNKRAVVDTVRSILDRKGRAVLSIAPTATVFDAVAEMAIGQVGALAVVVGGKLVGIISERDYARKVILQGKSSKGTAVEEIMTPSPITVEASLTVDECMRIMTEKRIRHLPVVEGGELKGMISIGDLVKSLLSSQAYTIEKLHSYIGVEYPS